MRSLVFCTTCRHSAAEPTGPDGVTGGERLARTTPLRRLGTPEDATAALLYLLEGGDFVTGEVLAVDGGRLLR